MDKMAEYKDQKTAEKAAKFSEKLQELLSIAKKKKNVLEYQEISDFFKELELGPEQLENVLDFLEQNNIDVLRITNDDDDEEVLIDDDDEIEMENIDLSVPDGVSIEDPVRMYLKEIGKVHRNTDRPGLIRNGSCNSLTDPPSCVRTEFVTFSIIEFFHCLDQPEIAFLDKIQKKHSSAHISFGYADHKTQIGFRQTFLCFLVS